MNIKTRREQHDIPRRSLGASGIEVAELGLGCNRIGEDICSDGEWIALLHRAADLGVTIYDTAAQYAGGRSEELIGKAFGNRADVVIATKVSPVREEGTPGFTRDVVIAGAEKSLKVLQRDCIDVFQTHGGGNLEQVRHPEWAEAMDRLKEQGKIRLRAAAVFSGEGGVYAIENGLVDALQITYNLIDTVHADPILPVADKHGIALLARMPYQRGVLTGKFAAGSGASGHRAALQGDRLPDDIAAAEAFRELGEARPGGMPALAMQFVLAERRLSCTIPGARSIEQLEANLDAACAPALTDAEAAAIAGIRSR